MFKTLIPIIGILIAVGLFFTYILPTFREVQAVTAETNQYAEAVDTALELQRRVSELKEQQNNISLVDLERLEAMVPDRIDEVGFLVDLDQLAKAHNLSLGKIQISNEAADLSTSAGRRAASSGKEEAPLTSAEGGVDTKVKNQYTPLDISFSVSGSYDDFRGFSKTLSEIRLGSSRKNKIHPKLSLRSY